MANIGLEEPLESLVEKFNNLSIEKDNFQDVITNLKIVIVHDDKKLRLACSHIKFQSLIDFTRSFFCDYSGVSSNRKLSPSDLNILKDISVIMDRLLNSMESSKVFELFTTNNVSHLILDIQNEDVQQVYLQQIHRIAESCPHMLTKNEAVIQVLVKCIAAEFLSVASLAKKTLNLLFSFSANLEWFFSCNILKLCKNIILNINMEKNSTLKFRFFEMFTDLVLRQASYLELCNSEPLQIFDSLFIELSGHDILSQLNALEIISQLATCPEGLNFLQEKGVLNWINQVITSNDIMMNFLVPGAVKCFGNIAVTNPTEIIPKYPKCLEKIFILLSSDEASLRSLCAETIGIISSRPDGLKLLYSDPDALKQASRTMGEMICSFGEGEHTRRRTLDSLVLIFKQDDADVEASMICEKLYRYLDSNPMHFVFNLIKQPYSELKYGAYNLLKVLARYSWIEQDIALCAGFLEYIMDRKTEQEKEGRELKYDIIKCLSISATSRSNLGITFHDQLCKYVKEGPLYSETHVAVETAEA